MNQYNFSISVVIPVYNDEEVLPELHRRLVKVLRKSVTSYEIAFVDDGSSDDSIKVLLELKEIDKNIKIIQLARNFGQQNAISAGLEHAEKDIIVIMDSDLQDRPEDIPKLLDAMIEQDVPIAITRWISRQDSFFKVSASKLFNYVINRTTSLKHKPGLGVFRALRREIVEDLREFPETTATGISLMYWLGYKYAIVDLQRDPRYAGSSGYSLRKMFELSADRLFSYSLLPIRMASLMGTILGFLGFMLAIYFTFSKIFGDGRMPGWTSIVVIVLLLFGANFLFLGIIGEYLGRIFLETKRRPKYIVSKFHGRALSKND
jgi:polyisoprenyl-phosphate glycosyltransferase